MRGALNKREQQIKFSKNVYKQYIYNKLSILQEK